MWIKSGKFDDLARIIKIIDESKCIDLQSLEKINLTVHYSISNTISSLILACIFKSLLLFSEGLIKSILMEILELMN